MSLHKSKGLTSEAVFVVGAVDGVVPTVRSDDASVINAARAEGRRLFYVAITRASHELVVSCAIKADLADATARGLRFQTQTIRRVGDRHTVSVQASPYIAELGPSAPKPMRGAQWLAARQPT
jgi:ATP-dependent DNA helicase UvrD/PcrA